MSAIEYEFYSARGPALTKVRAIAVTTSSANQDISVTPTEIAADVGFGRLLELHADGADVYYGFYLDGSLTIDQANTTQGNSAQCARIPSGTSVRVRPPYVNGVLWKFLYYKGASACTLRISVVSEDIGNKMA